MIDLFDNKLKVDIYQRLNLAELAKSWSMQATFLVQLGLLSVGSTSVLDTEDKLQFSNTQT